MESLEPVESPAERFGRERVPPRSRFWAALRVRCPVCTEGRPFRGWFRMRERCPACGFRYQREYGYFTGSLYFHYGATAGLLTAIFLVRADGFGVPLSEQWPWLVAVAVLFPAWFFRYARLFWVAFDLSFCPPRVGEFGAEEGEKEEEENRTRSARRVAKGDEVKRME